MRLYQKWSFIGVGLFVSIASGSAAELPSRNAKTPPAVAKAQTCEIDGHQGFKLPGSETCMRVSGYISAGVTSGNLKPGYSTH
jgi:hypothetical protein